MGVARLGGVARRRETILNLRKLNLRLLLRRENAVQRTPPRAHSADTDYATYTVPNLER